MTAPVVLQDWHAFVRRRYGNVPCTINESLRGRLLLEVYGELVGQADVENAVSVMIVVLKQLSDDEERAVPFDVDIVDDDIAYRVAALLATHGVLVGAPADRERGVVH
jgi:hypothetical protein